MKRMKADMSSFRIRALRPRAGRGLAAWLAPLALVLALSACDSRQDGSSGSSSNEPAGSGGDACLAALSDFGDTSGFCVADATAEGGDVICYTVDGISGIDPGTVTVAVEPPSDVYGFFHTYDSGGTATEVGLTMGSGTGGDDGISLLIGAAQGATGVFPLGRFSSWSGPDQANYRAIGQSAGCGRCQITEYGAEGTGRLKGRFDAKLCAYNGTVHEVQCALGEIRLRGAFDVTRAANVTGGSGTPF